jgi:hypothetical protein
MASDSLNLLRGPEISRASAAKFGRRGAWFESANFDAHRPGRAVAFEAVISEMGRLAVQAGQQLVAFIPKEWEPGLAQRIAFLEITQRWFATFYPQGGKQ